MQIGSVSTWRQQCVDCMSFLSSCVNTNIGNIQPISDIKSYADDMKNPCHCYQVRTDLIIKHIVPLCTEVDQKSTKTTIVISAYLTSNSVMEYLL